jgi:uncharacterized protein (TIGR03000 family)
VSKQGLAVGLMLGVVLLSVGEVSAGSFFGPCLYGAPYYAWKASRGRPVSLHQKGGCGSAALIAVCVPAGAELWFNGEKTAQNGTERVFTSPPLENGRSYSYQVRATWTRDGRTIEQSQMVSVESGSRITVAFPTESEPGASAGGGNAPSLPSGR